MSDAPFFIVLSLSARSHHPTKTVCQICTESDFQSPEMYLCFLNREGGPISCGLSPQVRPTNYSLANMETHAVVATYCLPVGHKVNGLSDAKHHHRLLFLFPLNCSHIDIVYLLRQFGNPGTAWPSFVVMFTILLTRLAEPHGPEQKSALFTATYRGKR